MQKPFKTLDEQIDLLISRNLIITDKEKAKKYLLTNNFYNIINGYSKYFPREGDIYINKTTFDEVWHLYLFDKELKEHLMSAILSTETHVKSSFAYRFAEQYPDITYSYLRTESYDPQKLLDVQSTLSKLYTTLNRAQHNKDNKSIAHYINNYHNVPIWVLINYIEFGNLRHMIKYSPQTIQNKVAVDMVEFLKFNMEEPQKVLFSPEHMLSFLSGINDVRNICAHTNRLLDFHCKADVKYLNPLHHKYGIETKDVRNTVYDVFIVLQCFLTKPEYGTLHNKIRKSMNRLDNCLSSITINQIISKLGFPNDWNRNQRTISY